MPAAVWQLLPLLPYSPINKVIKSLVWFESVPVCGNMGCVRKRVKIIPYSLIVSPVPYPVNSYQ